MNTLGLLSVALCLGSAVALLDISSCKKVVGDPKFDFEQFISGEFKYEFGSVTSSIKDSDTALLAPIQIDDLYYLVSSANQKDGNQLVNQYVITEQDGAVIREVLLENGKQTEKETLLSVYGYKPFGYIQFAVCDGGSDDTLRYVLSYGSYKLTPADVRKIVANDKANNFSNSLVRISTGTKVAGGPQ